MMIIQSKMKKTLLILIVLMMIATITMPVFAATGTIKLSETGMEIEVGKTEKLRIKSNTTGEELNWFNTNPNIASVNVNKIIGSATITGKKEGKAVITVKTNDGKVKATCTVTVTKKESGNSGSIGISTGGTSASGTATGIGDAIGGLVSGIGTVVGGIAESGVLQELLQKVIEIVGQLFQKVVSGLGNIDVPSIEIPTIELPNNSEPENVSKDEPKLEISFKEYMMREGSSFLLSPTVDGKAIPADSNDIKCDISNDSVVVNGSYVVSGVTEGETDITVTYYYKSGITKKSVKAVCHVTVLEAYGKPLKDCSKITKSYNSHSSSDKGVDYDGVIGDNIYAVADGKVITSVAKDTGYGEYIVIEHMDGSESLYAHGMEGSRKVEVGDVVSKGDIIMKVGNTGNVQSLNGGDGSHLHFELKVNGRNVNPKNYIKDI